MERISARASSICLIMIIMLSSLFMITDDDTLVSGHAPDSIDLRYDYSDQILNVTISHDVPVLPLDQHYIESITVLKNEVEVISETYSNQPSRDAFSLEFLVDAEDGDVIEVSAVCNLQGELTEEMTVQAPRDRMRMSFQPETLTYVEMGEQQDFTILIEKIEDDNPVEGVDLQLRAALGEMSEASDLGIGAYQFSYTAPVLDDEDTEVINVTATKNGYHKAYFEFSFDITYPLDPDFILVVDISPGSASIKELEIKDFSISVYTESGTPVDVGDLIIDRSGGQVSQTNDDVGEYTITFRANQVPSDTTGFLAVTAEKEGYQRGYRRVVINILDDPSSAVDDDDDDDPGADIGGGSSLLEGNNIIVLILLIVIAAVIIGIVVYRKVQKKKYEKEYQESVITAEVYEK